MKKHPIFLQSPLSEKMLSIKRSEVFKILSNFLLKEFEEFLEESYNYFSAEQWDRICEDNLDCLVLCGEDSDVILDDVLRTYEEELKNTHITIQYEYGGRFHHIVPEKCVRQRSIFLRIQDMGSSYKLSNELGALLVRF